jgi:hypothetical protein
MITCPNCHRRGLRLGLGIFSRTFRTICRFCGKEAVSEVPQMTYRIQRFFFAVVETLLAVALVVLALGRVWSWFWALLCSYLLLQLVIMVSLHVLYSRKAAMQDS